MRNIIFLFVIITFAINSNAQKSDLLADTEEFFIIHTDSKEYSISENIWFKIYCLQKKDSSQSEMSKLGYVELVSPEGLSIKRKKVLLEKGLGSGNILISDTISSGIYKFIVYTNWMKNYKIFYETNILIYNPEKSFSYLKFNKQDSIKLNRNESVIEPEFSIQNKLTKNVILEGLKNTYQKRDEVHFYIQLNDSTYNSISSISVSVRKSIKNYNEISSLFYGNKNNSILSYKKYGIIDEERNQIKNIPENKGILLTGRIIDEKNQPYINSIVSLSFVDSLINLKLSPTDSNGVFQFFIEPNMDVKDIVLNPEDETKKYSVIIQNHFIKNLPDEIIYKNSMLNNIDTFNHYLKDLYINNRITLSYNQSNESILNNTKSNYSELNYLYFIPDETIFTKDYILLSSMEEYLREVAPGVKLTTRSNQKQISILSSSSKKFMDGDPAIFIDGVQFDNLNSILSLNTSEIDRIEIVKSKVIIYNKVFDGIIGVFTNENQLTGIELPFNYDRIDYKLFDKANDFELKKPTNNRIPYYKNTLLWNPNININSTTKKEIVFTAGDSSGWYEIIVKGISSSGRLIHIKEYFYIEKSKK